jgi:hypothetical protein
MRRRIAAAAARSTHLRKPVTIHRRLTTARSPANLHAAYVRFTFLPRPNYAEAVHGSPESFRG